MSGAPNVPNAPNGTNGPAGGREAELAAGLDAVRARIAAACATAGRRPDEVGLVVVTKFFPASDVRLLAGLGVREVAENRHPEGRDKAAACSDLPLRWHYIGGLQSNKAAAVAGYADIVESVDRAKLIPGLERGAEQADRELEVLIQVSLDGAGAGAGAEHRAGIDPGELDALAERVAGSGMLRLRGLMAVAPLGEDPERAFARLAEVREVFLSSHPAARVLSAGMSGDLEHAVAHGATHVRVGSAVLGSRPAIK